MVQIIAEKIIKTVKTPNILTILDNISLTINSGESLAIMGQSGSGKTTLLGILAGLEKPTAGKILWDHHNLSQLSEDKRAQLRLGQVGFVFQNFQLLPHLTALENVNIALELSCNKPKLNQARLLLETLGLKDRLHHYPRQLSGGEQQRVALARAYVIEPKLLFADEPTGNLDWQSASLVRELLLSLQKKNKTTLIIATHDDSLANECGCRVKIDHGVIRELS